MPASLAQDVCRAFRLFGLEGHAPGILLAVAAVLALAALSTSLAPARRAVRIEPMQALRHEG